jgi:hypothetical protein
MIRLSGKVWVPSSGILFLIFILFFSFYNLPAQDTRTVFGISAGLGYGRLRNEDAQSIDFNFKTSYTQYGSFTLEVPMQKMEQKGSLQNELTFMHFDAVSHQIKPDSSLGFPGRDYYEINQHFSPYLISVTNMFRYCFTKTEFKYYLSLGIYNSFIVSTLNEKKVGHFLDGQSETTTEQVINDYARHGIMLVAGTGITYKYAGIEFRFDPGRNYTRKVTTSVYMPTIMVMLHVRLNP